VTTKLGSVVKEVLIYPHSTPQFPPSQSPLASCTASASILTLSIGSSHVIVDFSALLTIAESGLPSGELRSNRLHEKWSSKGSGTQAGEHEPASLHWRCKI
jgi:hypothetical protein